ncbi:hypothetical protein GCM10020331_034340 [Ectobacillus funiculus]
MNGMVEGKTDMYLTFLGIVQAFDLNSYKIPILQIPYRNLVTSCPYFSSKGNKRSDGLSNRIEKNL